MLDDGQFRNTTFGLTIVLEMEVVVVCSVVVVDCSVVDVSSPPQAVKIRNKTLVGITFIILFD